jgi:phospholipid/cholesterol/gamma-HCH transport system substrate-binding protein
MARSTVVHHETAVGWFVVLALGLFASTLVVKGARVGFGAKEVVFTSEAGHDLRRGAPVHMRGIEVGEVRDVRLRPDNTVEVRLKIFPDFRDNVHADAVASIVEPPILGSTSVELSPGTQGAIVEGQEVQRGKKEGIMKKLQTGADDLSKIVEKVDRVAEKADSTLATIGRITSKIDTGQGVVGRLINDQKLADDFVQSVKSLSQIADDAANGRGTWSLLKDEKFAPDLRGTISDVRSMTDAIAEGRGSLGRLVSHEEVVVEAEGALKDLRHALTRLDEISNDARATTTKVQAVLDSTKGAIDKLDGTVKNAEKAAGEIAQVAEKINKGQGTIGKLVTDDAIFRETKSLLKELRESVEDLREQAPINAFIGVVFSAF